MYEVSVSDATDFDATVGDILGFGDYVDWNYRFGLVVYTRDVPGEQPLQVVGFWTEPQGAGYP